MIQTGTGVSYTVLAFKIVLNLGSTLNCLHTKTLNLFRLWSITKKINGAVYKEFKLVSVPYLSNLSYEETFHINNIKVAMNVLCVTTL